MNADSYDALGRPLTVPAAQAMTTAQVRAAVAAIIARMLHIPVEAVLAGAAAEDGSAAIKSQLAIFAYKQMVREVGAKVALSKVPHEKWSSIDGVASVILNAFQKLKGK